MVKCKKLLILKCSLCGCKAHEHDIRIGCLKCGECGSNQLENMIAVPIFVDEREISTQRREPTWL